MPTRTVNLSNQQAHFVDESIRRHGFLNTSAVVRAGLQLLERHGPDAVDFPRPAIEQRPSTLEEATQIVDGIMHRFDRSCVLEDQVTAIIDSSLKSGAYHYVTDALADLARYVEMRLDREQPGPDGRHLRLTKAPAA